MNNLDGKRILFFDGLNNLYHKGIVDALNSLGAIVIPLIYKDFENRSAFNLFKRKFLNIPNVNERAMLYSIRGNFDYIFVKNPEKVSKVFFNTLRQMYPGIKMINYNWNSISHVNYLDYISLFDKVYSFDPIDAKKYNLEYYPLFYLPDFEKIGINKQNKKYSISFVGSAFTPGRPKFLSKLTHLIDKTQVPAFLYFHAFPFDYYKNTFLRKIVFRKHLSKKYFSHNDLIELYSNSRSFIDHPMEIQNGHTIRTFETLASGLLLITTNKALREEPFFDKKRIKIVKEDLSDLNLEDLMNFTPSFPYGFEKYRIDNWLLHILS